jgi:IS5 family transposase
MEDGMAWRRIGQEDLIARAEPRSGATLTELAALIDWDEIERHLRDISAAAKGELGWPPLSLFRGLLLATWHDLSDVRLAEALDDRTSFRRFCGFAAHEPTPERTAFVSAASWSAVGWICCCSRRSPTSSRPRR